MEDCVFNNYFSVNFKKCLRNVMKIICKNKGTLSWPRKLQRHIYDSEMGPCQSFLATGRKRILRFFSKSWIQHYKSNIRWDFLIIGCLPPF